MYLHVKNISLSLIFLIITILLSEFLLRYFIEPIPSGWNWNESPRRHLSNLNENHINQLGCRGQKIEYGKNDFVILLLGDSQVEAATVHQNKMPELILERLLIKEKINAKVFSLGVSGWGQDQQLIALQNYYKTFRADMVLIWATPKNDFWENSFPDRSLAREAGHLKPTFRLENSILTGPYFPAGSYYKNSTLLQLLFSGIQGYNNENLEQHILEEWEEELPSPHKIENSIKYSGSDYNGIDLKYFSENLEKFSDQKELTILIHEDFLNSRSHFSPFAIARSKRDNYLIKITKALIEKIKVTAESNGSKFNIFYPVRQDYDIVYRDCISAVQIYSLPKHRFPVYLDYLQLMKDILMENDLIYFDIGEESNLSFSNKDRHLSETGNHEVMKQLAEYIINTVQKKS